MFETLNVFRVGAFRVWVVSFVLTTFLTGCSSLSGIIDVINGNPTQKITRTPIWVYKPDIVMRTKINGEEKVYKNGVGTTPLPFSGFHTVEIWSMVNADRVEISTCSRHDVCQKKGGDLACDKTRFTVPTDWWGNPGKYLSWNFEPDRKERSGTCANALIAIYDKKTLAAWGYMVFRANTENTFSSIMTCNATDIQYDGVSVCSAKAGTIQQISFSENIEVFEAEETCNIKKLDDVTFEFQPVVGWCRASFMDKQKRYHDVIINGYDEVLVRE